MLDKTAFVFPGQGSQSVGMLAELASDFPSVKDTFAEASEVFGQDMWKLIQEGPAESLALTEITQPVMLVAGAAVWVVWKSEGGQDPAVMAGHSLGEYTALHCAGALSLQDAVRLVSCRGEYMRDAMSGGTGKMAAVLGLDDQVIIDVCQASEQGGVVEAVNFNAPGQVVIAGDNEAVDRAILACKEAGARKAASLPISVPCHSRLMRAASDQLAATLDEIEIKTPCIPVVNNIEAGIESDPSVIKQKLIEQLYGAVRWVQCVQRIIDMGVDRIVECGPGKVLSGLNKRIDRSLTLSTMNKQADIEAMLEAATVD